MYMTEADREELAFLSLPAEDIFNGRQQSALHKIGLASVVEQSIVSGPSSLYIILKATRLCNLRCSYCNAWREGPNQVLSFEILADLIKQAMHLPGVRWLHIIWHGGETTMLAQRYFERAIWLQEHFRTDGRKVEHSIQSNATRIDDKWARFFRAAGISVGVSLDLDPVRHDEARVFREGHGSYAATIDGISALKRNGVPFGVLAVIDDDMLRLGADEMLQRIADYGIQSVGLLNCLPPNDASKGADYLPWQRYVAFLRDVFAIWNERYAQSFVIRELHSLLGIVEGLNSRLCIFQGGCMGQYLTIEPDGRVSACDKYVGDASHCFGNLNHNSLSEMLSASPALALAREAADQSLQKFQACRNYVFCRGGCPHDARLNALHGANDDCCGLDPLIEDIKAVVSEQKRR